MAGIGAVSLLHAQIFAPTTGLNTILRFSTPHIVGVNSLGPIPTSLLVIIMENSHTPALVSTDMKTPPAATKRTSTNRLMKNGDERAGSEPVDPTALSKALKDMEDAGRVRERTPGASPSRKRQRVYGDR